MMQSDRTRPAVALLAALALASAWTAPASAAEPLPSLRIRLDEVTAKGTGQRLGTLRFSQTNRGLVIHADLRGLLPGRNSLHLHQVRSCGPAIEKGQLVPGAAAGPHWDPKNMMGRGAHGHGHGGQSHGAGAMALPLGDLPDLIADADGVTSSVVAATRLTSLSEIQGLSVIVHRGVDGPRFACGLLLR